MIRFTVKKGHRVYLGSVALIALNDTEFAAEADSPDHLAELLAVHGGQRAFGEHISSLTHDEVISRDINGVPHDVDVTVSYGAGGARVVTDKEGSEPRPKMAARQSGGGAQRMGDLRQPGGVGESHGAAAARGGIGTETVPGASGSGKAAEKRNERLSGQKQPSTSSAEEDASKRLAASEAEDLELRKLASNPRMEFTVPPKRFPDEVQTATDPPREELVADSPERAIPYVGEFTQTGAFTRQPSRDTGMPGYPNPNAPSGAGVVDREGTEGRPMGTPDTPGTPNRQFPAPSEDAKTLPDQTAKALQGSSEAAAPGTTGQPVDKTSAAERAKGADGDEDDLSDLNDENTSSEDEADELPEGFPHRAQLEKAGVTKYSELEGKSAEELSGEDFKGIGPQGASDILAAMKNKKRRDAYRANKRKNK